MSDEVVAVPVPVPPKPGYKTTEFWLTAVATFVGLIMASDIIPSDGIWPKITGLVVALLSSMGYTVSRGMAKKV